MTQGARDKTQSEFSGVEAQNPAPCFGLQYCRKVRSIQ